MPEELLHDHPDACVRIPMRPTLRSLNLSNSVAIAAYEALRQWGYPDLEREGSLTRFCWEDAGEEGLQNRWKDGRKPP